MSTRRYSDGPNPRDSTERSQVDSSLNWCERPVNATLRAMSYVMSVARSVFATDWHKRRRWSAYRRGAVVLVSLVVFSALFNPDIGALASVAALYVGLQDRAADPPRYTVRIMLTQSLLLATVVLVAGVARTAWVTSLILIAFAGLSGLTARRDKAVSRLFADIIAVLAFLGLSSVSHTYAAQAATAVLAASLLQTALTRATVRFTSDLPERRPVAAALLAVATHLEDAQVRSVRRTGEAATAAIGSADASLARSDLSHQRRRALRKLLGDAEALREEAAALRARRAFDTAVIDDDDVSAAIEVAADTLRTAAAVLAADSTPTMPALSKSARAASHLPECAARAAEVAARPQARGSATAIAHQAVRVARHTNRLLAADATRRPDREPHVRDTFSDDLWQPGVMDIRAGLRLALAAALGLLVAHLLHLPHGGWVAATTVALLRPDHRALTSDTIARAMGTAVGAALVIPLVFATQNVYAANIILVAVLAVTTYIVTSANEGLYIIAITIETVFTRAVVGEDPVGVAISRVTDVLLGCALAVVLLLVVPLRHGRRLRHEIANYADATADWVECVARLSEGRITPKKVRRRHRAMVSTRATVQHALDVRRLEPLGPGLPPWLAYHLYTSIHDASRACVAAEMTIRHGVPTTDAAAASARRTVANLRFVAATLHGTAPAGQPPESAPPDATDSADDVARLLGIAERESAAAADLALSSLTEKAPR